MPIKRRAKLWTSVGSAVLIGTSSAALAQPDAATPDPEMTANANAQPGLGQSAGEGEGEGSGGEGGGEFGVDPADALTDPVPFITALDVIRAHYLAGLPAYAAGETGEAAELFLHPISEVYVAMEPAFAARDVEPFQDLMSKAGDLAFQGADQQAVQAAGEAVLAAVDAAEKKAPDNGTDALAVQGALLADMIERAALQYQFVAGGAVGAAYLDGFGFYQAGARRAAGVLDAMAASHADLAEAVKAALATLERAYPAITQPDPLPVPVAEVLSASSRVRLAQ